MVGGMWKGDTMYFAAFRSGVPAPPRPVPSASLGSARVSPVARIELRADIWGDMPCNNAIGAADMALGRHASRLTEHGTRSTRAQVLTLVRSDPTRSKYEITKIGQILKRKPMFYLAFERNVTSYLAFCSWLVVSVIRIKNSFMTGIWINNEHRESFKFEIQGLVSVDWRSMFFLKFWRFSNIFVAECLYNIQGSKYLKNLLLRVNNICTVDKG
mgnify:CR=1 FL=1